MSLQPPINSVMARTLGSPLLAASCSIAISLFLVVALWLFWSKATGDLSKISSLPWWVLIGGAVGAAFVVGGVVVAPMLGVALFFVCVVLGQLLAATVADHFGFFGMAVKPISLTKVVGLALVLAGAALVQNGNR